MNINESFFSQSYECFNDSILANKVESISHIFPPLDCHNITLNKSSTDFESSYFINNMKSIINNSNISYNYKEYYNKLIDKYFEYYKMKFNSLNFDSYDNIELKKNDIGFPNNFYFYFKFILKFKDEHLNRVCNFILKIIKQIKNSPEIKYIGIIFHKRKKTTKLPINNEKIKLFINYLYSKKDLKNLLIFELIYKFNANIGAIAKMRYNDLANKLIKIKIKQKGECLFKDVKCYSRLKRYIQKKKLKFNDFIFIDNNNINKKISINKINRIFNKVIKSSKVFNVLNYPKQTSEMFRIPGYFPLKHISKTYLKREDKEYENIKGTFLFEKRKKMFNNIIKEVLNLYN